MPRLFLVLVASAAMLCGAAEASSPTPTKAAAAGAGEASAKPQCFYKSRVATWVAANDAVINVKLQTGAVYQVTLANPCTGLHIYRTMTFDTNGEQKVCERRHQNIVSRSGAGPLRCPIGSIRLLAPEVAAALPDNERP